MPSSWRSPLARALGALVALYRATSAFRSPRCRFYPSCSAYALDSLRTHGALRGGWLSIRRILRCHPWSSGGVDYPPGIPADAHRSCTSRGPGVVAHVPDPPH